ncbi:hypothetical protein MBLNU230_g7093t1 [Neophaeotheca triangularis]
MASSEGTKVTKDPQAFENPKTENPGVVPKDSLAGQSVQGGGSFAANSSSSGLMDQTAGSLTANTTDTSNATKLDAAPDAEARQASGAWQEQGALNAGTAGKGPTYVGGGGGVGAGTTQSQSAAGGSSGAASSGGAATAGTAPGYASHPAPVMGDNFQPHGKNITEGGFDSNAPNASFTTDIGGKNDPSRVALQGAEKNNVPVSGGAGARSQGPGQEGGQYGNLDETSA